MKVINNFLENTKERIIDTNKKIKIALENMPYETKVLVKGEKNNASFAYNYGYNPQIRKYVFFGRDTKTDSVKMYSINPEHITFQLLKIDPKELNQITFNLGVYERTLDEREYNGEAEKQLILRRLKELDRGIKTKNDHNQVRLN